MQQICLLCEAEENYDEVDMFQRDILRLQELLRLLEQYLSMPSRRLSLVLGRDTHLLTLPKGQALTINLADLSLTTGLRLKRSTSSFEEQEGPLSDYPFAQLARPGGRPRRSTRHHLNDRTELTRWFTGQTVECFLKGPKKGETQQHVCIAEWASLEAMEVFQNPSRSSVQSWMPDGEWERCFVRPMQDLQSKGVMKYWESWTLDLQGPLIDGGAYERIKREAEALDKGQRGLKGCCIL